MEPKGISVNTKGTGFETSIPVKTISDSGVLSTYTPAAGDVFYIDPADGLAKPSDSSSWVKSDMLGVVVSPLQGASFAQGKGFIWAGAGEWVKLSTFGSLTTLQAIGATKRAYVGPSSAPGRISGVPVWGQAQRPVIKAPGSRLFSTLVTADLEQYVRILDEDIIPNRQLKSFQSGEITGNGTAQSTAHGLGIVPNIVVVEVTLLPTALFTTPTAYTVIKGSHTATDCIVTVPNGAKYTIFAM